MVDIFNGFTKSQKEAIASLWKGSEEKERRAFIEVSSAIISILGEERGSALIREAIEIGMGENAKLKEFPIYASLTAKSWLSRGEKGLDRLIAFLDAYIKKHDLEG